MIFRDFTAKSPIDAVLGSSHRASDVSADGSMQDFVMLADKSKEGQSSKERDRL